MKEQDLSALIDSSAVLSDMGIFEERRKGRIIIEPFNEKNVQTSSYDLTLGENYFIKQETDESIINIFDVESPRKIWGQPKQAVLARDFLNENNLERLSGIKEEDRLILVPPGGLLLIHSYEFAGSREGYTTLARSKSTLERMGIGVAISAGMGDVGYFDRWTFALSNWHNDKPVPLVAGMTFAQIIFLKCTPNKFSYPELGHYQTSSDLKYVMDTWSPARMLPRTVKEVQN